MTLVPLMRTVALAAIIAAGISARASAQATAADPGQPAMAQATSPAEPGNTGQGRDAQPGQPDWMPPGVMGRRMMDRRTMDEDDDGMMRRGMMGGMMMGRRGHMMKVMFIIVDVDGDGALSFEEVTTIHKRIFDRMDADKNGKVTPEEIQSFIRE